MAAETIQGQKLYEEIRYVNSLVTLQKISDQIQTTYVYWSGNFYVFEFLIDLWVDKLMFELILQKLIKPDEKP